MKSRYASSVLGMLLALLIISILFVIMMPSLRGMSGSAGLNRNFPGRQSAEDAAEHQIKEIEKIHRQTLDINRNFNQEY